MGITLLCALSLFLLTLLDFGHARDAVLTFEPNSTYLFSGESVTFVCDMREGSDTDWFYTFNWNGQQLVSFSSNESYSLQLTVDLSGDYQCIGHHRAAAHFTKQSNNVTLSVSADRPTPSLSADRTSIPASGAVKLTCSVDGSTDWKYEWFRRSTSDSSESQVTTENVQNFVRISHAGMYRCRGRRGSPVFFSQFSDVVRIQKTLPYKSFVTRRHNWTQIYSDETITLRCEVQGHGDTEWEYEWRTTTPNTPSTHCEYRISSASVSYIGNYWCKARKDLYASTDWSVTFTLTVSAKPSPTVLADKRMIPVKGNVTLTCSLENSAEWKYDWFRRSSHTSEAQTIRAREEESSRVINVSQGGIYSCRGRRGDVAFFTELSNSVTIEKRVSNKAVVSLQPNWPLIFTGETVTFSCGINGGGSTEWEYEWSKPKSSTVSTNLEYSVITASVSNSGNYRCMGKKKSDLYSSTEWSSVITLVVSDRPTAHLSADNTAFPAGGSVALTCSVNPSSPGWRYDWYRGEKPSEPLTTQDAVFHSNGQISVSQEGLYWCRGGRGDPVCYTEYSDSVSIQQSVNNNNAVVTLQPNWPKMYSGETVTLRCEIQGGDTEWEYEWMTTSSYKLSSNYENRIRLSSSLSDYFWCKGRQKRAQTNSTGWSMPLELRVFYYMPRPVLTVSPSWLSPGASVTLKCEVEHPSAGWRFFWSKAVPKWTYSTSNHHRFRYGHMRYFDDQPQYSSELLPGSRNGTEQDSYMVHGQTHTAGYVCQAGRGDPVVYTETSEPTFVWSGDVDPSASLTVSPDTVQHFNYDFVSLSCEGNSTEWRVKRFPKATYGFLPLYCSNLQTGSICNLHHISLGDAVYWCESGSGEFSNGVNITVTYEDIILVSPVYPVNEGDSVSLDCRVKKQNLTSTVAFYKNGKLIHNGSSGELKISAAAKSDEGFYKCQHSSGSESQESWMSVKSAQINPDHLIVPLITGLVCGVVLIILLPLLLCWYRKSKNPCRNSLVQSERANQSSATSQPVKQDENQQQIYSSLLHGDVSVYETIGGSVNTGDGGRTDQYRNIISQIQLKAVGQRRSRDDPGDSSDYCNENPDSATGP